MIRACDDCGHMASVPMAVCNQCHSWNTDWKVVKQRGTIYSYTTVERQVHPAFPAPYTVVLVQLDDAPTVHLLGQLRECAEVIIGMAVEGYFEMINDAPLLRWKPLVQQSG